MKKTKIKMQTTLASQFVEGNTYDAIIDNGTVYLPAYTQNGGGETASTSDDNGGSRSSRSSSSESDESTTSTRSSRGAATTGSTGGAKLEKYTEKELQDMDAKDIRKMIEKAGMEEHIPDDGKKETNMKMRNAYLAAYDAQNGGGKSETKSEEGGRGSRRGAAAEEETPARGGRGAKKSAKSDVEEILGKVDAQVKGYDDETALADLQALGGSKKNVEKIFKDFLNNPKTPMAEFVDQLTEEIDGGDAAPATTKAAPAKGAAAKKSEVLKRAEFDDMVKSKEIEEGQRVGVLWEEEDQVFDGEIAKIDRKGVYVKYDDETEGYLTDNNTEIELLD